MPTQYTPILKLALPVEGELDGTWGDTVNDNITSMVEQAVAGAATINTWTANVRTLTVADGTTSESRCAALIAQTGAGGTALTAAGQIICPAATKLYVLKNDSAYAVTLKTASGTGIAVPSGTAAFLFCDGTNVQSSQTTLTLPSGTANGVVYLDGSKVATAGSSLVFDGTNLGVGTASPSYRLDVVGSTSTARFGKLTITNDAPFLTGANIDSGANSFAIGASGASPVAFFTNNTERMRLDASGNLGIGTTSPGAKLDVTGTAAISGAVTLSGGTANGVAYLNGSKVLTTGSALTFDGTNLSVVNAGSAAINVQSLQSYLQLRSTGAFNPFINFFSSTSTLEAQIQGVAGGAALVFATGAGAAEQMRLTSTGLGIGTSSPSQKLHVVAASAQALFEGSTQGSVTIQRAGTLGVSLFSDGAGKLAFYDNNAGVTRMTLDASGNLGIGTSSPTISGSVFTILNVKGVSNNTGLITVTSNDLASSVQLYSGASTSDNPAIAYQKNLRFGTTTDTGIGGFTERMRLDASGNLGIGQSANLTTLDIRQNTLYSLGLNTATQNYSFRIDSGASDALVLGSRTTSTDMLWLTTSGNLGLGVTPSAWFSNRKAFDIGGSVSAVTGANITIFGNNYYTDTGGTNRYVTTGAAAQQMLFPQAGGVQWFTAPSGTAGNAITFTQAMTLAANGTLNIDGGTGSGRLTFEPGATTNTIFSTTTGFGAYNILTLNGSQHVFQTSATERMRLDASGNLGLGVTPSAWGSNFRAIQYRVYGSGYDSEAGQFGFVSNAFNNNTNWIYRSTNPALHYEQDLVSQSHRWFTALSGTAGNAITFTQAMTLDASGNLLVGTTTSAYSTAGRGLIEVNGSSSALIAIKTADTARGYFAANTTFTELSAVGASQPLVFTTNAAERMRLDTSGNLGIGTSSPDYKLDVDASGSIGSTVDVARFFGNAGSTAEARFLFGTTANEINAAIGAQTLTGTDGALKFYTEGSGTLAERMRIDAAGNLGLGVTPSAWSLSKAFQFRQNATASFIGNVLSSDELFVGRNAYYDGTNFIYANSGTLATFYQQASNGQHIWSTAPSGTAGNAITFTQAMTLDANGNLLIGTTSAGSKLTVDHGTGNGVGAFTSANNTTTKCFFVYSSAAAADTFRVFSNGNVVNTNNSYGAISDLKLKENITDATPKLDDLLQVRVVNYNLKTQPDQKHIGVIAQELEQVLPGLIEESPDRDKEGNDLGTTTKSVKYSVFIPMLIKAIQEQQALITDLRTRVAQLERV
jgi:hypothetical protein